ncbi:MAG: hypothetical protein ACKPBA_05730 [Planctomycetota bacterium]
MQQTAPRTISPLATALTLAAVAFAVAVGMTAPRLRDRHGSPQQDLPLGDLAAIAAIHESRAEEDAAAGRARERAIEALAELTAATVGTRTAPDLASTAWSLDDVRNVELAPGLTGTMLLYRSPERPTRLSITMLPDAGHAVRLDGFGRAAPIAPGQEWRGRLEPSDRGPARVAWALADGRVLWLVLAEREQDVAVVAPLLK